MSGDRHSVAQNAELINDPQLKAERESLNAVKQAELVELMVETFIDPDRPFKLRPSTILSLQRAAMDGLSSYAGLWRPAGIEIGKSEHTPVGAHLVPELVEGLCDYVNENWNRSAIHLASYCMWRLNWIHPFTDGNGRTSRALSYLVLSVRLGYVLPSSVGYTIPDQIVEKRAPYYEALEAADRAWKGDIVDLAAMEKLLESMLAAQLLSVFQKAVG
jgi:Fic family protein